MKPRGCSEYANGQARGFVRVGSVERSRGASGYGRSIQTTWPAGEATRPEHAQRCGIRSPEAPHSGALAASSRHA